jgi:hypothetical protein
MNRRPRGDAGPLVFGDTMPATIVMILPMRATAWSYNPS